MYVILLRLILLLFPFLGISQTESWKLAIGGAWGKSLLLDDVAVDQFKWKNAFQIRLVLLTPKINIIDFESIFFAGSKGAFNKKTLKNINLSYIGIQQIARIHLVRDKSILGFGIYANLLLNRKFTSEYPGYDYEFEKYDLGGVLKLSQSILKLKEKEIGLDVSFSRSFVSIYDNQHKVILTDGYSEWTHNFDILLGIYFIL